VIRILDVILRRFFSSKALKWVWLLLFAGLFALYIQFMWPEMKARYFIFKAESRVFELLEQEGEELQLKEGYQEACRFYRSALKAYPDLFYGLQNRQYLSICSKSRHFSDSVDPSLLLMRKGTTFSHPSILFAGMILSFAMIMIILVGIVLSIR
jgi:hypothetical protein